MERKIIDGQVNLGESVFGPNCDIGLYIKEAKKIGVTGVVLLPVATHRLTLDDYVEESCIWNFSDGNLIYQKKEIQGEEVKIELNPSNPYSNMNAYLRRKAAELTSEQEDMKFFPVSKVHPILDSEEEVISQVESGVVALKIQGLATYANSTDVPSWFNQLIDYYQVPILIHTDYLSPEDDFVKGEGLRNIIRENDADRWADWAAERDTKICLTHGVRLSEYAAKIINSTPNVYTNLGPDMLLQKEKGRLKIETDDFLKSLFNLIRFDKIMFSTDYRWNALERENWDNLDWGTVARLNNYLSDQKLERVLRTNAEEFFEISVN